ncbi:ATP-binding cassette domain-containing protein, partial [Methylobacterium radiotolerans]|uniref:ATP-binding cassette domain-containing protein n=1 Tax=Methylobacterium radiotolerans TaxID=31998 RepID=UPI001FD95845
APSPPPAPGWGGGGVWVRGARAETLALVGESGCGQATVAKALMRLYAPTAGQVVLGGKRIDDLSAGALRPLRRHIQMVFQDPFSSLNPRMRVRAILAEPIRNFGTRYVGCRRTSTDKQRTETAHDSKEQKPINQKNNPHTKQTSNT